ncbi:septum formation initiator [Novosphingobium sp. ST904]|uniref:S10 family serine carboxypeptidase-like protein n=1 Tax=Novosphingobium sp. ST904 TaxID=1684385 RepID=UPI001044CBF6|nr:septum formation initiator [Novosphingobium sp. ST904]TCM40856.1 carboxypeptidase C (cathepsin A) [Novosphingobium sp. ST904]
MILTPQQPFGRKKKSPRRLSALTGIALVAASAGPIPTQAAEPPAERVLIDARVSKPDPAHPVRAELRLVPVSAGADSSPATAGYISYSRPQTGRNAKTERPVIFAFNGGPGASAAYLHMGLLGPVLAHVPQDPADTNAGAGGTLPGPSKLYDVADVVFIDPPGTGFSERPAGAAGAPYSTVEGDANAAADVLRQWLTSHGRHHSPFYILGESYGTIRAVAMLDALDRQGLAANVRGVVLLGQALNMIETSQRPDNVVTYAVSLPTLAAIACYHGMVKAPCTAAGVTDAAASFAREDYLPALYRGRDLPQDERDRLAARLAELTGIPAAFYLANDLRISKERFRVELLRAKGKVMGRYDARYLADRPANVTTMMPGDPSSSISDIFGKAMTVYLGDTLKAPGADTYKVIARFEGGWSYGAEDSPFADWPFMSVVERHAATNACLRLFVGTGIYDTTTTIGAADYLFAQSSLPKTRYRNERYVGGHVFYSDDGSRARFQSDLVDFINADSCRGAQK